METQNMMKAKQSELWDHYFSFVFSFCHSFVKSSVFLYLENLGDNPYFIVILNHGGNIKPHILLRSFRSYEFHICSASIKSSLQSIQTLFCIFNMWDYNW